MLIFTPRTDPLVDRMLEKQRNKTEGGRHRKKETLDAGGITSTQVRCLFTNHVMRAWI
jgi:hypothetical protein